MESDLLAHAKRRGYGRAERVSRRQSRAISHALIDRIYLTNDQHGDRRVDQGIQNRVDDYGVVQRLRGETFKQQSDQNSRADRAQITDNHKGYSVAALKTLVGL